MRVAGVALLASLTLALGACGTSDVGAGPALDGNGNAYLAGGTNSTNFPTTAGAFDTTPNGADDAIGNKGGDLILGLGGAGPDVEHVVARRVRTRSERDAEAARREHGRSVGNATIEAITHLHRAGLFIVGGLIVGNPDDTRESIETNLEFARRYIDWPYIQHPTPYPGTPMTKACSTLGCVCR